MATKIQGLDRLRAKLAAMPEAARQEIKLALEQNADELVAMQKRLVPRDEGDLAESIGKQPGRHDLAVLVTAGSRKAFYARFVEFGTVRKRPRPFFFPAYRSLRKRLKGRMTRAINKAAKRVAASGA